MSTTPYQPNPIDTSRISVPERLMKLLEQLARNTHEVWAKGRMDQGWTRGAVRNDTLKQHPCLVPYENLSEEEKEYDRQTALETLKLILSLGYSFHYSTEDTLIKH